VADEHIGPPAGEVENRRPDEGDDEVQEETERGRRRAAAVGRSAEQAGGDRLQDARGGNAAKA